VSQPTVELFVVDHSGDAASKARTEGLTPVDLRPFLAKTGSGDLFAESSFLVSEVPSRSNADYIGLCSASYDLKWPGAPHMADLPDCARRMSPSQAFGEELATPTEWMASAEHNHPGMTAILERLAATFALDVHPDARAPGCNTFVCQREEFQRFHDNFRTLLGAALEWYGTDLPFAYRCPDCGTVSESGSGRWTRKRHVGYLGERITRLVFSSRPEVTFMRPEDLVPRSRVKAQAGRVARKVRVRRAGPAPAEDASATPWHLATYGIEGEDTAGFTPCPVCTNNAVAAAEQQ
jgi:hypothetical protein